MPVSVVVGGQFGSEGKGKVSHWLASQRNAKFAVRVGGPNSGHTVVDKWGQERIFQHLPTASLLDGVTSVVAAGSYINPDILLNEITSVRGSPENIMIDPNAVIIEERHREAERSTGLNKRIGSTASGTGAAVLERVSRNPELTLAKDHDALKPFVRETCHILDNALDNNKRILIEGTQGFGLSLLHADCFPYTTSRDTTAAAFVSEVGLSPLSVDEIVMVIRAFPIRVAGNSGPLPNETSWGNVTSASGSQEPLTERTTVTKNIRRVAEFDAEVVKQAIIANRPTTLVMNHVDYLDYNCHNQLHLSDRIYNELTILSEQIRRSIDFVGTGKAIVIENMDSKVSLLKA